MKSGTKLVIAGIAGLFVWEWWKHKQAQTQIAVLPVLQSPPSTTTTVTVQPALPVTSASPAPITMDTGINQGYKNDLLQWALQTANPSLYQAMINELDGDDINSLHQILVQQWETGAPATTENTAYWNDLRGRYPFLNYAGQGCTNFACN